MKEIDRLQRLKNMKNTKDYLHLYLGCEVVIEKSSYWCVHEFDYHKGEKRLLLPSVLTWVRNNEMIVKPILRPLSDMTEEEDAIDCDLSPAEKFRFRLSKDFDLFGLIEAGLAIDKTKTSNDMKTFPALYIDPQGVIRYIAECPEEPELTGDVDVDRHISGRYAYRIAAAKESSIPFQDQELATKLLRQNFSDGNLLWSPGLDVVLPLPKGYSIEILVKPVRVGFEKWDYVKVAVLTPIKNKKMKKWTETEIKRAKIRIRVEYKMGNLPVTSKEVILRPSRMEDGDIELFINLLETYGKSK